MAGSDIIIKENGAWRSLGAHLNGVQVVAGSNPAAPTIFNVRAGQSGVKGNQASQWVLSI